MFISLLRFSSGSSQKMHEAAPLPRSRFGAKLNLTIAPIATAAPSPAARIPNVTFALLRPDRNPQDAAFHALNML
jgi:hypothetical protein